MKKPLLCIGGVILALAGCGRERGVEQSVSAAGDIPVVPVVKAERHDLRRQIVLTGELTPFQEVELMAKVAGYIQRINVDVGDSVRQGQVLAVLEVPEMRDDLSRASAAISRNRAELQRSEDEIRRAESAHQMAHLTYSRLEKVSRTQPGLVAQQEVDDALNKDQIAEAQVAAVKSALEGAREQIKVAEAEQSKFQTMMQYTKVVAPFDGVVTKRYANQGSMIQAGVASQSQAMPVVRLSQHNLLRLILPVPESAAGKIRAGSIVEVRVPSLGRTFAGKVARTADQVDSSTRTMHTEVDVANPSRTLIPGMYAEIELELEQRMGVVVIPLTALKRKDEGASVMVVSTFGTLKNRDVAIGLETPSLIEIKSGLKAGEMVVIGNRGSVKPGQTVQVKEMESRAKGGM